MDVLNCTAYKGNKDLFIKLSGIIQKMLPFSPLATDAIKFNSVFRKCLQSHRYKLHSRLPHYIDEDEPDFHQISCEIKL